MYEIDLGNNLRLNISEKQENLSERIIVPTELSTAELNSAVFRKKNYEL